MSSARARSPFASPGRFRAALVLTAATLCAGISGSAAYATSGGSAVADGTYAYVAKVDVGGAAACTGALVAPQWIVTAASCFAVDGTAPQAGPPRQATRATIGRTDPAKTTGVTLDVVRLVPRTDRNLILAQLASPAAGITPVRVASSAPAPGDALRVAGYGRTETEWVPDRAHVASFTVDSVSATGLALTSPTADTCKGDAGGPAVRAAGGQEELVAVNDTSWQSGCIGETGTRRGSYEARVDDLGDWIRQQTTTPVAAVAFGVTADGVYHLFSATSAGSVYETYWKGGKTLTTARLTDLGSPVTSLLFRTTSDGYYHLFSGTSTGGIAETYWKPGVSLATQRYAELGAPVSAIAFQVTSDGVYHLFSATSSGSVNETYWKGGKTLTTGKLADLGSPVSAMVFQSTSDGYYHLFSGTSAGGVHETYWKPGATLATQKYADLGAPVAAVAFQITADGVYHLYSGTTAGGVHETSWKGGKTLTTAKLADIGDRLADIAVPSTTDGNVHLFAQTATGGIHEVTWKPGQQPAATKLGDAGEPVSCVTFEATADGYYHFFGGTYTDRVLETYWKAGQTPTTAKLADIPGA